MLQVAYFKGLAQLPAPQRLDPGQASERDQPFVLLPNGDELLIGQGHSLWRVTCTSQYNWQLSEITRKRGIAGLDGVESGSASINST